MRLPALRVVPGTRSVLNPRQHPALRISGDALNHAGPTLPAGRRGAFGDEQYDDHQRPDTRNRVRSHITASKLVRVGWLSRASIPASLTLVAGLS